jgi:very-short-patch-repair endonuclease
MPNTKPSKWEEKLNNCLVEKGLKTTPQHWDEHKHIDIAILDAKLYIEVDGWQHLTIVQQIEHDFIRDDYSKKAGFDTIHISNKEIEENLENISNAIVKVVKHRQDFLNKK